MTRFAGVLALHVTPQEGLLVLVLWVVVPCFVALGICKRRGRSAWRAILMTLLMGWGGVLACLLLRDLLQERPSPLQQLLDASAANQGQEDEGQK